MTTTSSTLVFPKSTLTPITGKPTNATVKILKREVYANAKAIPSRRGGGANGHLGMILPAPDYAVLSPNTAWVLPAHPGAAPTHAAGASGPTIAENTRVYNATLAELDKANNVHAELVNQILAAVPDKYLAALQHDDYGYATVTIAQMLTHLTTTYGRLTRTDLEKNRASITSCWNCDEAIEDLWLRLSEIKRIATDGNEPLTDNAIMELTFLMFEQTGVFTTACDMWRTKATADKTYGNFQIHFAAENEERLRKLTLGQVGFHGANAATIINPAPAQTPPTIPTPARVIANNDVHVYYCWTHGLGFNTGHTSATCQRKAPNHQDAATVDNTMGGNTTIMTRRTRPSNT